MILSLPRQLRKNTSTMLLEVQEYHSISTNGSFQRKLPGISDTLLNSEGWRSITRKLRLDTGENAQEANRPAIVTRFANVYLLCVSFVHEDWDRSMNFFERRRRKKTYPSWQRSNLIVVGRLSIRWHHQRSIPSKTRPALLAPRGCM